MRYDPIKSRNAYHPDLIRFYLNQEYDQNRPMGNVAQCDLSAVVSAWLVGLHDTFSSIVPRSLNWLDRAIESGEESRFGTSPSFHRMTLNCAKAVGVWMLEARNDEATWLVAQTAQAEFIQTGYLKVLGSDKFDASQHFVSQKVHDLPFGSSQIVRRGLLNDFMAFAFQDGQFEQGITEYEKHLVPKVPSLKKVLKPHDFAYALCLHRAGRHGFDESDLLNAGREMLQANLQENWLGHGQFLRAAMWLKIVYWHHEPTLTPLQTVLKAYEDMPMVPRPELVPARDRSQDDAR